MIITDRIILASDEHGHEANKHELVQFIKRANAAGLDMVIQFGASKSGRSFALVHGETVDDNRVLQCIELGAKVVGQAKMHEVLDGPPPMAKMPLVVIESPFAPAGKHHDGSDLSPAEYALGIEANINYCRAAMHDCFVRGEAPYASHILYTQKGVLEDRNKEQRALGIEAGLQWGALANKTAVYIDAPGCDDGFYIGPGMRQGIARAQDHGRPIVYRSLGLDMEWNKEPSREEISERMRVKERMRKIEARSAQLSPQR